MQLSYPGILVLTLVPGSLLAQEYDYHPTLSDRFTASLGAMRSSNSFDVEAGIPGDPGDYIDFNKSLGVSDRGERIRTFDPYNPMAFSGLSGHFTSTTTATIDLAANRER